MVVRLQGQYVVSRISSSSRWACRRLRQSPWSSKSTSCSRSSRRSSTPATDADAAQVELPRAGHGGANRGTTTVVYAWKEHKDTATEGARVKQLEIENLHLKQLIGNLSLEKKLLLERLAAIEPAAKQ